MLFPWLTTERLFESGEQPNPSHYQVFYDEIMTDKIDKMFAIISMNGDICVAFTSIFVDLRYTYNIRDLADTLQECLAKSDTDIPVIALYCGLVWISDPRLIPFDDSTFNSDVSTFRKTHRWNVEDVPSAKVHLHANMMLIDRKSKTVERFEPNTLQFSNLALLQEDIDAAIMRDLLPLLGQDYTYFPPTSFCRRGPQKDNYCTAWSLFYLHLRLINPSLSRQEIVERLTEYDWGSVPLIIDYLEVMKNTYYALVSKSKIYTRKQRKAFQNWIPRRGTGFYDSISNILRDEDHYEYMQVMKRIVESYDVKDDVTLVLLWLDFFESKAVFTILEETRPVYVKGYDVVH